MKDEQIGSPVPAGSSRSMTSRGGTGGEGERIGPRSSLATVYLGLTVVGTVVPLTRFLPWLLDHGLDVSRFVDELFVNRISGFFGWDVLIAVPVLWLAAAVDRDLSPRQRWLSMAGSCLGASAGLPLYLYLRERSLGRAVTGAVHRGVRSGRRTGSPGAEPPG